MYKQPRITKLFEFDALNVRWTFFKDGKFTLAWAFITEGVHSYNSFGQAFCSHGDVPDITIGCKVALHRLCKNLDLSRYQRLELFDKLEDYFQTYLEENLYGG